MARSSAIPFPFFGAGEATYYENASMTVIFAAAPSAAQRKQIEGAIPAPLAMSRWTKRTLQVATDDYALAGAKDFKPFNAAIERWLRACHTIAPIDFAVRPVDSEAGTTFSAWHRDSLTAGVAILTSLAKRYDDADTRASVKATLIEMLRAGGVAIPAKLDPTPAWRTALHAGDAKALAPLLARHQSDLQLALDPANPAHRRAVLGTRPKLATHGKLDLKIFEMALLDDSKDAAAVIDKLVARATKTSFWSTACASTAAELAPAAPATALAVLDRLVVLANAHPIVIENALWAVQQLGAKAVARDRLERYWTIAVAKLPEHEALHPYLVELAPALGRPPPQRPSAPAPRSGAKRAR